MSSSAPSTTPSVCAFFLRQLRIKLSRSFTGPIAPISFVLALLTCIASTAGCGGGSGGSSTPPNPAPSVSSLSPATVIAGGPAFTLTVTGSNFVSSSTIEWNSASRPTTFISSTSLQAKITAADIAATGTASVTVSSPTPGGGTSTPLTVTIINPVPTATSLSPNAMVAGSPTFTLTIAGTNFISSSVVQWNGAARTTTFGSSTSLQAAISAADIATPGTATITVSNPAPGGGTSGPLTFVIQTPPPTITLMTPSSAVAGGPAFSVAVTGINFFPTSVVAWNGSARPTTFISNTSLHADFTAADIAAIGTAKVTVVNLIANGGSSSPSPFFVGTTGGANFAQITIDQQAQDIAFDALHNLFYISVPDSASAHANTISVIDPSTGTVTASIAIPSGTKPNRLALSDDDQFLYAGIDGTGIVQRFKLPGLSPDVSYALGNGIFAPLNALDLKVAPGAPHTTAVSVGAGGSPAAQGGLVIFDDTTARPNKIPGFGTTLNTFGSIEWGADANTVFASNNETTGFDFYTIAVSPSGATLTHDYGGDFSTFENDIHFNPDTGLIYSDDGQIIAPSGTQAGNFDVASLFNVGSLKMVPDSKLGTAFFVGEMTPLSSPLAIGIESYDLSHFSPIDSAVMNNDPSNPIGNPVHLIRWLQNGLAFITDRNQVVLVGGNFVGPAPSINVAPPATPAVPPAPASNAPTIATLTPSSAIAGGGSFPINIAGAHFNSAASVQFNGNALPTTFVSSTQLMASVAAADIVTPGTARITVVNPSANGGASASATFFIGATGGSSSGGAGFAVNVINQPASDILYDPLYQWLYISVPGRVASVGNTVSVFDPVSLTFVGEQFAGADPHLLALSDDSQFLYVALDGANSVQRFTLPALTSDIHYALGADPFFGPFTALDLQVAPGAPGTTAVTLGNLQISPRAEGGLKIFDDATPRPTSLPGFGGTGRAFDALQWGLDSSTLYSANTDDTNFDFYTLSVTSNGVGINQDFPGVADFSRIHFDRGSKLVYTDAGNVIDPSSGTRLTSFAPGVSPIMVPDSTLNTAFFVSSVSGASMMIQTFNLTTRAPIDTLTLPNVMGNPTRIIRWGQNGLAFATDAGQVYLVGGNFIH